MQKKRKFFIMTASIGEGHSQAARAIAETIKQVHPDDAVRVLDFLSRDVLSIDHVLKESYLKMIRIFPEMYDSLYSNSQNRHLGATFQSLLSWKFPKADEEADYRLETGCPVVYPSISGLCSQFAEEGRGH